MDAPVTFGRMPMLAAGVANGGPEVLMTGLFGRSHFQIGWFEDVDAVLDLDAARLLGVDVFRRPVWGGGTAFYDTNATATLSFFIRHDRFPTLDDALNAFRPAVRKALDGLGLGDASFEGSSDLRWNGRKLGTIICQSILGITVVGGFMNLRKPDMELYAKVAHVPEEKFADKVIKDMVSYICTPADVRGSDLTYEEFRDAVADSSREVLGFDFEPTPFTDEEDKGTSDFASAVGAEDWICRISSSRFRSEAPPGTTVGFANLKAKKLIRAGVAVDDQDRLARAMMAGDMHVSPPDVMDRVAAALEGAGADDRSEIVRRVAAVFEATPIEQPDQTAGITPDDCAEAVVRAVKGARS